MTRYYQIGINKTETRRAFGRFITQNWNSQFYDDRNKFVNEGSKLIREVHKSTWDALVVKYKNEIKRRNYHNLRSTKDQKAHSISSLSFTVRPFEINRIVSQELIRSVSTPTIKSYIKRLEKTGVLKILSKNGQKWFIELNKNLVLLFDKYSQKQLTNSKFLNNYQPVIYMNKNADTQVNTIIENTLLRNKQIENDKSNLIKGNNFSQQQEQQKITFQHNEQIQSLNSPEGQEQTSVKNHARNIDENHSFNGPKNIFEKVVPLELKRRITSKTTALVLAKHKVVIAFWMAFVETFWPHKKELYNPETAPIEYLHFISQGQETLMNHELYFGTCNTEKRINQQFKKLMAARKSSKHWFNAQKSKNPDFNFDKVYPNTFLSAGIDRKLSFLKSIIYTESVLELSKKLDIATESFLIEKRVTELNEKQQHEINSLVFMIYSQKDIEKQKEYYGNTKEYISKHRPDLWDGLRYLLRADRIKQFMLTNQSYEYDLAIVTTCILNKQIIKEEIETMLPALQWRIARRQIDLTDVKFQMYFTASLNNGQINIRANAYTQQTLDRLKFYTTKNHK